MRENRLLVCAVVRQAPLPTRSERSAGGRLWEVDVARTVGIGLMVVYHVGYDIHFLAPQVALDPFDGGWRALQVTCASTFLAVVGISYWIADQRARSRGLRGAALWRRHARRGGEVLAAALLVSVATLLALGADDAVQRQLDLVALEPQLALQDLGDLLVVLDDEHAHGAV